MTVSSTTSSIVCLGNSVSTVFSYPFIADSASDIQVSYTDASGNVTILSPSTYTLTINAAATGQLWGVGGSVLYPLSGSPIASGTFLTIQRILPYTQPITISNQGDFAPAVIEEMGDTLEMQIQQIAARTTQFRGIWKTGVVYYVGDIVQDGTNGSNTKNYYICQIANTSGTWSTDLAAGDWTVSVLATVPAGSNSIVITGDVTASGTAGTPFASTLATVNSNVGQFAGITLNGKGLATAAAALTGDITSSGAATTLATVNSNVGTFGSTVSIPIITVNAKGLTTAVSTVSVSSGVMALLNTTSAISVTAVSFSSSLITSTYPTYEVRFYGAFAPSGTHVNMQTSATNGATYTINGYVWGGGYNANGVWTQANSASDSKLPIDIGVGGAGSVGAAFAGKVTFSNPNQAGSICQFWWECEGGTTTNFCRRGGGNNNQANAAINNIQFVADSGKLTGTFELWGIP